LRIKSARSGQINADSSALLHLVQVLDLVRPVVRHRWLLLQIPVRLRLRHASGEDGGNNRSLVVA